MAKSLYFQDIKSSDDLFKTFAKDGVLPKLTGVKSGSSWGSEQLAGAHVIVNKPNGPLEQSRRRRILPSLEAWNDDNEPFAQKLKDFVQGPGEKLQGQPECYLQEKYGDSLGLIWSTMQSLYNPEDPEDDSTVDEHDEKTQDEELADGVQDISNRLDAIDMEESLEEESLKDSCSSLESITIPDKTEYHSHSPKEALTVIFIALTTRYILRHGPRKPKFIAQWRDEQKQLVRVFDSEKFRAIDDGGISLLKFDSVMWRWDIIDNYVAIIEAKAKITAFDGNTPSISDKCLAQMACEAILVDLPVEYLMST